MLGFKDNLKVFMKVHDTCDASKYIHDLIKKHSRKNKKFLKTLPVDKVKKSPEEIQFRMNQVLTKLTFLKKYPKKKLVIKYQPEQ